LLRILVSFVQARGGFLVRTRSVGTATCAVLAVAALALASAAGSKLTVRRRSAGDTAWVFCEHTVGQLDGDGEHGDPAREHDRDAAQ
jgi:hypothetical protein